jgi:phage host-nuclease inhibitor protein Gam
MPTSECSKKIELLKDIQIAMGELMAIHNDEVVSLLAEDFDQVAHLKTTLQAVRDRKAKLIEAYRDHVAAHGC